MCTHIHSIRTADQRQEKDRRTDTQTERDGQTERHTERERETEREQRERERESNERERPVRFEFDQEQHLMAQLFHLIKSEVSLPPIHKKRSLA
jgi:hypothetical protein